MVTSKTSGLVLFVFARMYLQTIVLFHHSIRGAMEVFASEAAALQQQPGVSAVQLSGLVERHRWV